MTAATSSTGIPIGEKTFSADDQLLFARLSGDANPMHVDPIAARRLIAGQQVVHGMHILLAVIERWQNKDDVRPRAMSCSFVNPICIGDRVLFTQRRRENGEVVLEAAVNGLLCSQITVSTAVTRSGGTSESAGSGGKVVMIGHAGSPLDAAAADHLQRTYVLRLGAVDLSSHFPKSYRYFGQTRLSAILGLSYFVGMICPGLHSIFSTANLSLSEGIGRQDNLEFRIEKYDERFGLFEISLRGCIEGTLTAFQRPPPQKQMCLTELAGCVDPGEFRGTRSLVIGGSRGLGEIAAKLVAAGGGDVVITYASGASDAKSICEEINVSGLGRCEALKLDLRTDSFETMDIGVDSLDAVFFFATPRIYRKKAALFDPILFREFVSYYVERFYEMCLCLEGRVVARKIRVYFPSSVFVSERPSGMTEYAMAKAAAEVLVQDVNRRFGKLSVAATRLPRLNTDQTSSLLRLPTESNVEALLPVVRATVKG